MRRSRTSRNLSNVSESSTAHMYSPMMRLALTSLFVATSCTTPVALGFIPSSSTSSASASASANTASGPSLFNPATTSALFGSIPRRKSAVVAFPISDSVAGEQSYRQYVPASLYTADSNDQRYSARDWFHNILTLPRSSILTEIKSPLLSITIWSAFVSIIHRVLIQKGMVQTAARMCMSSKPHSLLVSALGLLLVFRTNSAYQRFTEGRRIWEVVLSLSRNMSRMASLYEGDLGLDRKRRIFRLLSAFPYLLRHHIQPQCMADCNKASGSPYAILLNASSQSQRRPDQQCWVDRRSLPWALLPDSALIKCADSPNRPLWVVDRLSHEITSIKYTDNFTSRERLSFLSLVDKLSQCIGECERIHQTAVPLNYARHSLRSLTIWLFTLPLSLLPEMGLLTAPCMAAIAWLLLGVYQIGYTIEDPFQGSLRLSLLCDAVYRDVMYIGRQEDTPRDSAFALEEEEEMEWTAMDESSNKKKTKSKKTKSKKSSSSGRIIPESLVGVAP